MSMAEAERLVREGVAAMQRRDGRSARASFAAAGRLPGVEPPWLLLAQACRLEGDDAAEEAALDRLLDAQPRNLRALVMKGDARLRARDSRAAASCYGLVLKAAAAGAAVPPALQAELGRVAETMARLRADYAGHVAGTLAEAGIEVDAAGARFARSLAILEGRAQIYHQQPTSFYFPGLPQIDFYDPGQFPWLADIEAQVPAIREELGRVLADQAQLRPYAESEPGRPRKDGPLADNPAWSAFYLWRGGVPTEAAQRLCPTTLAALDRAPMPRIRGRSPMALFSVLKAGTHIPPHTGMLNTRLICHLPLIVPPDCALRVGAETRAWEEGRTLIFDDSIEHEAWNRSAETRVVLLFEIWRPELDVAEQRALTALYEAIVDYSE